MRDLVGVSWSNFLVHVANKVVFSTDVVVVGIVLGPEEAAFYAIASRLFQLVFGLASVVTSLLYPAFAEYEGSGEQERQRRLLLSGLRGGSAAALVLALPLLLIPANLIHAWVGDGYSESAPVLALLALVLLVHQPVWMLTQYLIARGRQREIARLLILGAAANLVLSIVMALTVGTWGVALATLIADVAVLVAAVPLSVGPARRTARRPSCRAPSCVRRCRRSAIALVVFGVARSIGADTKLELLPFGIAWLRAGERGGLAARAHRRRAPLVLAADRSRRRQRCAAGARRDLTRPRVRVDRQRALGHAGDRELLPGSPAAGLTERASRARRPRAAHREPRRRPRRRPARRAIPVSPSATTSGTALTRVATTGSPASIASSSTIPKPSQRDVCTKTFARSSQSRMSVRPGSVTASSRPSSATSRRVSASSGPLPRMARRACGTVVRTRANARSSVA